MKYKVGNNVILNDDVEFWFKKVGGCEVPIVDTTTCSYKIKIGENQYVYIDDNSINHEATAKLKNEFRYKVGDKVKIKDTLNKQSIFVLANQILEIEYVDTEDKYLPYRVSYKSDIYWVCDDEIDHEATARLNEQKCELKINTDSVYLTSQLLEPLINSTQTKEDIKKGSDKMNIIRIDRLLSKWEEKRTKEIDLKYNKQIKEARKEDVIQKIIDKHEKEMAKEIKTLKTAKELVSNTYTPQYTEETEEKVEELNKKAYEEKDKIYDKVLEIKAVLNAVESEEKVFDILIKQKIIDNNYNIL